MKQRQNETYNTYALFALIVVAFVGILISLVLHIDWVLSLWNKLLSALFPVFCAAVTLLLLLPLYDLLIRLFTKRLAHKKFWNKWITPLSLIGTYLAFFGILALIVVVILPQFRPLYEMVMHSADYLTRLNTIGEEIAARSDFLGERFLMLTASLNQQIVSSLSEFSSLIPSILSALSSVVSHVSGWILGFIISIYALLSRDRLKGIAKKLNASFFKGETAARIEQATKLLYDNTLRFFSSRAYNALILGGVSCLFFYILGLKFYASLCVLLMFGSFIPVFGTLAAATLGGVIVLITDTSLFIGYVLLLALLLTCDRLLLVPRITRPQVKLSLGVAMLCVLVGWFCGKLIGAIFAVPIYVTLRALFTERQNQKRNKEDASPEAENE